MTKFQSTLPAWGATSQTARVERLLQNFNPRSPHGERRSQVQTSRTRVQFQSTLPAWGATL